MTFDYTKLHRRLTVVQKRILLGVYKSGKRSIFKATVSSNGNTIRVYHRLDRLKLLADCGIMWVLTDFGSKVAKELAAKEFIK